MQLYKLNQKLITIAENENFSEKDFEELSLERSEKIQNISLLFKNLSAFQDAITAEIKSLTERKKILQNKLDSVKNYLQNNLAQGEKFNEPTFSISWRKSESIEIDPILFCEEKFAKEFPDLVKTKIEVDKVKLKELIKTTGVLPDGIELTQKNNLIIK